MTLESQAFTQAVIVPMEEMLEDRISQRIALFNPDGTPFTGSSGEGGGSEDEYGELMPSVQLVPYSPYRLNTNELVVPSSTWPWKVDTYETWASDFYWAAGVGWSTNIGEAEGQLLVTDLPSDGDIYADFLDGHSVLAGVAENGSLVLNISPIDLTVHMSNANGVDGIGVLELAANRVFNEEDEIIEWGSSVGRLLYWSDSMAPINYAKVSGIFILVVLGLPEMNTTEEVYILCSADSSYYLESMSNLGIGPQSGGTEDRVQNGSGSMFFDTDLNRPIWWNGNTWVFEDGSEVDPPI